MEAVPRLPMIHFELKISPEPVQFGPQLKQYIANFYNEDPESYNTEINNLEALRAAAIRPTTDVAGCQLLKKYYCQLHFLKSRFPMEEMQASAVYFTWKDTYSNMPCKVPDIRFEMMCILYNIGALHTQLGASDSRTSPDGLKMACTHFQCAAWAFQTVKETYFQMVPYMSSIEVVHFMQQVCFAQAQECILEKSMMDNRKATITAKVAVQVVDHYKRALTLLTFGDEESSFNNLVGSRTVKEWSKYLSFKVSYHKCIALLFQGQQAEEQQKMGERVAFYQAACEQLEDARKLSSNLKQQKEVSEAIAFTSDVVEGKRKAAKNENEFIYHEEVPERQALQEVKGASLVKGIAFNVNDLEVSGPDIFAKLVPMEAHEASSLYSEKKAQKLRQLGELVESKDQALAEFMSSLQLDVFNQMRQATGLTQDLVDRAAALSAKPGAIQELISSMGKLSNSYHEVESMLNEIQELLKEEENNEKEYQELMGKRPPSIIATDLAREAAKYREAHNKANDSNENLHKAMTTHVANLKILSQSLQELQQQIPSIELPNPNIDEASIQEIENLIGKVEEMRNQRAMLWTQFREAVHKDDITGVLVTRQADQPLDQLFHQELQKHEELTNLIEQNAVAQENILKAFVEAYAKSTPTRRYLHDVINKRNATVTALITSYDTYEDLLAKANKGIDFYNKLETNVSKLLQRIKSASKVQQEEREQLLKNTITKDNNSTIPKEENVVNSAPKLKDYLDTRKKSLRGYGGETTPPPTQYYGQMDAQQWPPAVRPPPLGSEVNTNDTLSGGKMMEQEQKMGYGNAIYPPQNRYDTGVDQNLVNRLQQGLRPKPEEYYYTSYTPEHYTNYPNYTNYPEPIPQPVTPAAEIAPLNNKPPQQAFTVTTSTYQPISSTEQNFPYTNTGEAMYHSNYPVSYNTTSSVSMGSYQTPSTVSIGSYQQQQQTPSTVSLGSYPEISQSGSSFYYNPETTNANNNNREYATSVHPNISMMGNYNATYSMTEMNNTTASVNMSNGQSYPSYDATQQQYSSSNNIYYYGVGGAGGSYPPSQQQQQMYPQSGYGYGYVVPETPVAPPVVVPPQVPVTTKESNLDLLTGLDFTVNQAPLIPQQNPPETVTTKSEIINKPISCSSKTVMNKEDKGEEENNVKMINRKPLNNNDVKKLLEQELDKFEKFFDTLTNKTLSGPTNLDLKWKEIQDKQEVEKRAISVARCYPMKNRYPDILPYDYSRVELRGTKDDYINASHVKDISYYSAPFIVTQAPIMHQTIGDFWTMIKEQQVELIVCLLSDQEIANDIYWPLEKGKDLTIAGFVISIINSTQKPYWIERLISINIPEKRDSRTVMHLQFTSWPGSLFPTNPDGFVVFITEVINMFLQQRNTCHPIVVHCSSGIGRSGVACLLISAILELTNNATSIPDLVSLSVKLASARKNILRDREHLKFGYEAFLVYMKQVVAQGHSKRILNDVVQGGRNEKMVVVEKKEPDDPLNSLDPFWASKKYGN